MRKNSTSKNTKRNGRNSYDDDGDKKMNYIQHYLSLEKNLRKTLNTMNMLDYSPGRIGGLYGEVYVHNKLTEIIGNEYVLIGKNRKIKTTDLNVIRNNKLLKVEVKWSKYGPWEGKSRWGWAIGKSQIEKADYFIFLCANKDQPGEIGHTLLIDSKEIQQHFKEVGKRKGLGGSEQYYLNIWEQVPKGIKISKLEEKFNIKKYEDRWKEF